MELQVQTEVSLVTSSPKKEGRRFLCCHLLFLTLQTLWGSIKQPPVPTSSSTYRRAWRHPWSQRSLVGFESQFLEEKATPGESIQEKPTQQHWSLGWKNAFHFSSFNKNLPNKTPRISTPHLQLKYKVLFSKTHPSWWDLVITLTGRLIKNKWSWGALGFGRALGLNSIKQKRTSKAKEVQGGVPKTPLNKSHQVWELWLSILGCAVQTLTSPTHFSLPKPRWFFVSF